MPKVSRRESNAAKIRALVRPLLEWFSQNARDLPWRRTQDPYAIWISEIMLQQTQVKKVIPYWQHWMRELPTVQSLARARPEKVLKLWEGLGYYTRARNLQTAARMIVARHGGHFPERFEDVLALPGIGRYTAGAICSIAFNQPMPVLDGNVTRVLCRIFGMAGNPREQKTNARLWSLAGTLVRQAAALSPAPSPLPSPSMGAGVQMHAKNRKGALHEPGGARLRLSSGEQGSTESRPTVHGPDARCKTVEAFHEPGRLRVADPRSGPRLCEAQRFMVPVRDSGIVEATHEPSGEPACSRLNQALMELGAVICTPRQPKCPVCPVRRNCVAFRENRTEELPNLGQRTASTKRRFVAFIVERKGRLLVRQVPGGVVNAGLWEFPNLEVHGREPDVRRLAKSVFGSRPLVITPVQPVRHTITRFRITMDVYRTEFADRSPAALPNGRWRSLADLKKLALPSAHRKIWNALMTSEDNHGSSGKAHSRVA